MKYKITKDERWPDYIPYEDEDGVEIPSELIERWKKVCAEYDAVQDELKKQAGI